MSVVKAICNKVAIIDDGELIESGRIDEVNLPEDKFFWLNKENELKNREQREGKEAKDYVG